MPSCSSDATHKDFIADEITYRKPKVFCTFSLTMKVGLDSFRAFSIQSIMKRIKAKTTSVIADELVFQRLGSSALWWPTT